MFDPKALFLKRRSLRLAGKLASRNDVSGQEEFSKALDVLERHFDVRLSRSQIACSYLIQEGCFAELATGEGKTFAIALAAATLALKGRSVHVLTPNDYLADRDWSDLKGFYSSLGLSSSAITSETGIEDRFEAYASSILYSTPSCIAFDRMREDFKQSPSVTHQHIPDDCFLILDEADAILIENGSVPFIASSFAQSSSQEWVYFVNWARSLDDSHVYYDPDSGSTQLTDLGYRSLEDYCVQRRLVRTGHELYSAKSSGLFHKGIIAVRAVHDMEMENDYIVSGDSVRIINHATGRIEPDRQWGSGMHQAIEVKHELDPSDETDIRSRMTVPDIVRLYADFSGTSATITEAATEVLKRYGRLSIKVPRNHRDRLKRSPDSLYKHLEDKQQAIVKTILSYRHSDRPILVGVESILEANQYSQLLSECSIPHQVLTAHDEEREAAIIANAGLPGSVTIATNMAGRGTDIKLGGGCKELSKKAMEAGGLLVIGTSRQVERRLDRQLAGRAGRQGEPGEVKFFVSLEDELFKGLKKPPKLSRLKPKFIRQTQSSQANKIGISREEFDTINQALQIQTDIFLDLRRFWLNCEPCDLQSSVVDLFVATIRNLLHDFSVMKVGIYGDFEGFMAVIKDLSRGIDRSVRGLDNFSEGAQLCAEVEKATIAHVGSRVIMTSPDDLRSSVLGLMDNLWASHLILVEQIYDHAKWQAMIQKNEKIEFILLAYSAFSDFIQDLEKHLINLLATEVVDE